MDSMADSWQKEYSILRPVKVSTSPLLAGVGVEADIHDVHPGLQTEGIGVGPDGVASGAMEGMAVGIRVWHWPKLICSMTPLRQLL